MTPNKENLRKWVAALRSGEFKQGRVFLTRIDFAEPRYCCLGVACAISGVVKSIPSFSIFEHTPVLAWGGKIGELPEPVQEWLGLPHAIPMISEDETAALANDTQGWSFDHIANAIERHYGLLEVDS